MRQDFPATFVAPKVTLSAEKSAPASTGRLYLALLCALAFSACSTSPNGRTKFVAPAPVSKVYSEVDMQVDLIDLDNDTATCAISPCTQPKDFEKRIEDLGARLALAAFAVFPDASERVEQFEFDVANNNVPGSTSNSTGRIVIFNGTQLLQPDDTALAFLIAREMGRVIGQHHDENSATRLLISVVVGVLFPASNLFSTTAISQTAYSSTMASTAASTATSMLASKLALDNIKPEQLSEADSIALALLTQIGIKPRDVAASLARMKEIPNQDAWARDFYASVERVEAINGNAPETQVAEAAKAPKATSPHLNESMLPEPQETQVVAVPINDPYTAEELTLQKVDEPASKPIVVEVRPKAQVAGEMATAKTTIQPAVKILTRVNQGKKRNIPARTTTKAVAKPKGTQASSKSAVKVETRKASATKTTTQAAHKQSSRSSPPENTHAKKALKAASRQPKPVL
jgi:hypothetical protein